MPGWHRERGGVLSSHLADAGSVMYICHVHLSYLSPSHSVVAFFHSAGAEMNPTSCLVADSLANFTAAQRRPAVLCRCCIVVT